LGRGAGMFTGGSWAARRGIYGGVEAWCVWREEVCWGRVDVGSGGGEVGGGVVLEGGMGGGVYG